MAEGFNHFPQTAVAMERELKKAVKEVAKSMAADAAVFAPVDTGFLEASIYYSTATGSSYGKGHARGTRSVAKALYQELFPEVKPDDDLQAVMAVGATYGMYVELGTRYMGAQPYFYPAVAKGNAYLDFQLSLIPGALGEIADL
jgi:hypothetical protein